MDPEICRKGVEASLILYALSLPLSISAANIALGLVIFFTAALAAQKRARIYWPRSLFALAAFFLWAAATVWIAEKRFDVMSLNSFSKIWNVLGMVFIPAAISWTSPGHERVFKVLFAAACLVVLAGLAEMIFGLSFFSLMRQGRFYGFQSHPLHAGGLYCLLALTALSLALYNGSKLSLRIFWAASGLILSLGVILTRSRGYYLAFAAGCFVILCFKGVKAALAGIVVGAVMVAGAALIDAPFRERLSTINVRHTDESARIRVRLWRAAAEMIKDHPIAGVGYRKWRDNILDYSRRVPDWFLDQASFAHAHNSYLTFAAETGIIGLALFLSFWFMLVREQWRFLRTAVREHAVYALAVASLAGLLGLLAAACFEHNLLTATPSLCLFFLIGLSRVPQEEVVPE